MLVADLAYALQNNPSIAVAKAHIRAAQSHAAQIGMRPNTRVGFSGQQLGSSADTEQIGIVVEQEILRGNKRQLDQEISEHDINRLRQALQIQQQRVQTDVTIGYFNVLCTQKKAKTIVRRAQAESVPDINIQAILQHDSSIGAANGNLMVSVPVPIKKQDSSTCTRSGTCVDCGAKLVASLRLQLQQRLAPVFQAYTSSQQQITTYRESILVDAQESLDLTKLGYEGGEFSHLELLTAQRTYSQANLD